MPSLVVLQSAHNDIFDFLVDKAARFFVHFVTHCGSAFSPWFCKGQSAVSVWISNALFNQTNMGDATSVSFRQPFLLAREWAWFIL